MSQSETRVTAPNWAAKNHECLEGEMRRLRLLLRRRVLWLRSLWRRDPLQEYQGLVISEAQADWLLEGEDREAESRFYKEDPAAVEITREIDELSESSSRQRQGMAEDDAHMALDVLAHLFGLTPFERNVLLLCLAPELDQGFERLYAYVQDDATRKHPTPHLAMELFGVENDAAQRSFLPESPLRRFRLIVIDRNDQSSTAASSLPMRLDERIADYLRGINRPDERVVDLLRPMPQDLLPQPHEALVHQLQRFIASNDGRGQLPVLNLIAATGRGKRTLAGALCKQLGLQLYNLDFMRLPASGRERHEAMPLLEREAALFQMALYVDADDIERSDKTAMASLKDVVEGLGAFLIVGSRDRWQSERGMVAMRVPRLDEAARRVIWQQALTGMNHSTDGHIEAIVEQFDFGPGMIAQAVVAARTRALMRVPDDGAEMTDDDLWQACREQVGWNLDELAQHIVPYYTWGDIVLPEDVFRQLQEIAAQVANRPLVYEAWGFGAQLNRGRGISALFSGPSGAGKTMAAEILSNHLKLDLYRIDLAGVVSKYIGETEKNLRKVFDAAEQSGAILLFDEADALFGKRSEVKDSHDRYANIEVNYLLQRMEDYRGLAILATNRKSALDRAFMRRLRFLVDFPFPDAEHRGQIWQKVFPRETPVDGLDYECLSRLELTGGNIKNIALNAAFLAASDGGPVGMSHIIHASRREYAKIDKMVTEAEWGAYYKAVKR